MIDPEAITLKTEVGKSVHYCRVCAIPGQERGSDWCFKCIDGSNLLVAGQYRKLVQTYGTFGNYQKELERKTK